MVGDYKRTYVLRFPGRFTPQKVARAAIRVNEMPVVHVYATSRVPGPVLSMGCRSHKVCDGRGVYGLECMSEVRWRNMDENN